MIDFFKLSNLPDTIKDYFKPDIDTIKELIFTQGSASEVKVITDEWTKNKYEP